MNAAVGTATLIKAPRETRKFPRLTVPMDVRINNIIYPVSNWSTDGIGVANFNPEFPAGHVVSVGVLLMTSGGTIRVDLRARLVWKSPATQQCGLQFVNPEPKKVTLMNEVISLNLSGQIGHSANQAFGLAKKEQGVASFKSRGEGVKRIIGLCLFALIGASSVLFLGKILYGRMFLFEASSASVFSDTISLTSPAEGIVREILSAGTVKNNQALAKIDLPAGSVFEILSPCDCEAISVFKKNGSFVRAGETVTNLVRTDAKPVVSVRIAFHDLERVVRGAKLSLLYLDGTEVKGARIIELPKIADDSSSLVTLYVDAGRALLPSQVGQPVYAVIDTGPW